MRKTTWIALICWGTCIAGAPAAPPAAPTADASQAEPADPNLMPIDLGSALRLAGVENPEILIAQQRIILAAAERQFAAAQILPTLHAGMNFDAHTGMLMQASGRDIKVNRDALYVGAGANAVAAGSVGIPGVVYNLNVSNTLFSFLEARQNVERQRLNNLATRNEMLRRVAVAYLDLLRAEARRSVALKTRVNATEVARLTAANLKAGTGQKSDADRAATELERRDQDVVEAEADLRTSSAGLAELLNLDAALRLHPIEDRIVPTPIVPDPIPLQELLAIAMVQRPELGAQQAAIRQSLLALRAARWLPFSPNIIFGYSGGTFGGGSNLTSGPPVPGLVVAGGKPRFDQLAPREDLDAVMYWSIQNLGLGNRALVRESRARLSISQLERVAILNDVREQVASAYVRTHARYEQLLANEAAVQAGDKAFAQDTIRIRGGQGLPLELMESLQLLAQSRVNYVDAIVAYNRAQLELYVALGQPPADMLARPVPTGPGPLVPKKP